MEYELISDFHKNVSGMEEDREAVSPGLRRNSAVGRGRRGFDFVAYFILERDLSYSPSKCGRNVFNELMSNGIR